WKLTAELGSEPSACSNELVEVEVRLDIHPAAHPHEIFGGQVSAGHLRERRAADPADARVEDRDAFGHRREDIRQSLAVGVVEVVGDLRERDLRGAQRVAESRYVTGRSDSDGVA